MLGGDSWADHPATHAIERVTEAAVAVEHLLRRHEMPWSLAAEAVGVRLDDGNEPIAGTRTPLHLDTPQVIHLLQHLAGPKRKRRS